MTGQPTESEKQNSANRIAKLCERTKLSADLIDGSVPTKADDRTGPNRLVPACYDCESQFVITVNYDDRS